MIRILMSALILISFNAQASLKMGDKFPMGEVVMKSADGKDASLDMLSKDKKGTLVIFSCNTCPFAKAWKDRINEIGKEAVTKGLAVAIINSNDSAKIPPEDMANMKMQLFQVPYLVDATSDIAREFGAEKTPDVFLFNKDKKLVYKGAVDDNSDEPEKVKDHYLKTAIAQLVDGKPIQPNETKSVGCGIKFRPKVAEAAKPAGSAKATKKN